MTGRTTRGPQYSKDDTGTDLYISAAGEDILDDDAHNPFKQDFSQPIPDADDAALAALAGRYTPPKNTTSNAEKRQHASPGPVSPPPELTHSESSSHEEHEPGERDEEGRPAKRQRRKYSETSKDLVVQPGDDVEEDDRKMRANLQRVASEVERGDGEKSGTGEDNHGEDRALSTGDGAKPAETTTTAPADETNRPAESDATDVVGVEPVPLEDKLANDTSDGQKEATAETVNDDDQAEKLEDAEEDADIEPKEGDDYDVENYAEFEDDQDDFGEELDEEGPAMDERQMMNEEELIPSGGVISEDQGKSEG